MDASRIDPLLAHAWMQMKAQGMKQKALATRLGITEKHMSHLFHGNAQASVSMLRRILWEVGYELTATPRED